MPEQPPPGWGPRLLVHIPHRQWSGGPYRYRDTQKFVQVLRSALNTPPGWVSKDGCTSTLARELSRTTPPSRRPPRDGSTGTPTKTCSLTDGPFALRDGSRLPTSTKASGNRVACAASNRPLWARRLAATPREDSDVLGVTSGTHGGGELQTASKTPGGTTNAEVVCVRGAPWSPAPDSANPRCQHDFAVLRVIQAFRTSSCGLGPHPHDPFKDHRCRTIHGSMRICLDARSRQSFSPTQALRPFKQKR